MKEIAVALLERLEAVTNALMETGHSEDLDPVHCWMCEAHRDATAAISDARTKLEQEPKP
jgi:hypothetical protein